MYEMACLVRRCSRKAVCPSLRSAAANAIAPGKPAALPLTTYPDGPPEQMATAPHAEITAYSASGAVYQEQTIRRGSTSAAALLADKASVS